MMPVWSKYLSSTNAIFQDLYVSLTFPPTFHQLFFPSPVSNSQLLWVIQLIQIGVSEPAVCGRRRWSRRWECSRQRWRGAGVQTRRTLSRLVSTRCLSCRWWTHNRRRCPRPQDVRHSAPPPTSALAAPATSPAAQNILMTAHLAYDIGVLQVNCSVDRTYISEMQCWKWDGMEWYAILALLHSAWNHTATSCLINTTPVCWMVNECGPQCM